MVLSRKGILSQNTLKAYCLPQAYFFHTQNYCRFRTDLHKMKIKHRIIGEYSTKRCFFNLKKADHRYWKLIIPSPTKLQRNIVTLPSVLLSIRHILVNTRINILQWILTKLGTYLVFKRIWNPIDFQGHRSKVKVTRSNFYRVTSF